MATKYAREDRYKAAAALVATGNSKAASRESHIPASTIRHWSQHNEDFQLMCQEIKTEYGEKIKYKYAEIINESADQTLDRLRNGDVVRDTKTGDLVRVPIKGKDAAIIGAVAFDKLRLAESQPTTIVQLESRDEHLQGMADKFEAIALAHGQGDAEEYHRLTRNFSRHALPPPTKGEND